MAYQSVKAEQTASGDRESITCHTLVPTSGDRSRREVQLANVILRSDLQWGSTVSEAQPVRVRVFRVAPASGDRSTIAAHPVRSSDSMLAIIPRNGDTSRKEEHPCNWRSVLQCNAAAR